MQRTWSPLPPGMYVSPSLITRASLLTDAGKRRQVNEDWCGSLELSHAGRANESGWLWVVADGVGAYGTGEEASRAAGETVLEVFKRSRASEPRMLLRRAIEAGNAAVRERRRHYVRLGQSRPVMTTMLAVTLIGSQALFAHVGDCRAYLIRRGRIRQITRDHTWVGEQVARGLMTPEQARGHPRSHVITRSLGQHETVEVDLIEQALEPGDRLVLCSDGLTRHLEDGELLELARLGPPDRVTRTMIELANSRGGEDNITVGVVELAAADEPTIPPLDRVPSRPGPNRAQQETPRPVTPRSARESEAVPSPTAERLEAVVASPVEMRDHLAMLHAIGRRISASLDLTETLESVMNSVVEVTGGERGFVMLWDDETEELTYSVGRNVSPSGRRAPEFSRNLVQSVFESGQPALIGDALADPRYNQYDSVVVQSLRSVMCAPLEVEGKRIGVVYVENRLGAEVFSQVDLELLSAFAGQAAIALANARLHQQLKQQMAENAVMRANQEHVLRSISSAIVSMNAEGQVLIFNRMAEEIFGLKGDQARGQTLESLLPAGLHRTMAGLIDNGGGRDDELSEVQLEVRLPHRGRAVLSVRALPLSAERGDRIGTVLLVDDITQARLLAEARQREEKEKERVKALFGRYLAPSVVDQLLGNPDEIQLGGTRRMVTVLFADIRGFTGIAERNEPEAVVRILNSYLACATEVILGAGGTLDKFLGDGVMAFFNAPLPQEQHALAAVRAALEMQARLRELTEAGGYRIAFGVGINTGEAIVGNIGTDELMNYTVIGDVVNVAARLQAEARAGEVLLSGAALEQIGGALEVEELGSMHVKGRAQPVPIYKVVQTRP